MQVLGIKNRTMNVGFTIPTSLIEKIEQGKPSYESRSHYVSRLLSAALEKTQTKETEQ